MQSVRPAILALTLTGCATISGCNDTPQIESRDVFREAIRPEVDRLALCAVTLADQFERRAITQEAVGCVVAVARNQVEMVKAVAGDA